MAKRLNLNPTQPGKADVNTTGTAGKPEKPLKRTKDRSLDRHSPGYMREYMRAYRARQRSQGAV